jgi:uncharacterized repeat protein (TIGR04138 family)
MAKQKPKVREQLSRRVTIERIAAEDGRYLPDAFYFVYEALDHKLRQLGEVRHLRAGELLDGFRSLAHERFGLMARVVLEHWGVNRTDDVGEIVYLLIENGLLFKTDEDSKSEFQGVFEFRRTFDDSYDIAGVS